MSVADRFPVDCLGLWCRDGIHLSDTDGMSILVDLLCDAAVAHLPRHEPPAAPRMPPLPRTAPRPAPRVVVRGVEPLPPRKHPRGWTVVGQAGKVNV